MRTSKVLSISLPAAMLADAEALATEENRTMSGLVQEALRAYQRERTAARRPMAYSEGQRREERHQAEAVRVVRRRRAPVKPRMR